ncbi:uncharacterized protein V1510DRAFT_421640 [Dipodascopsis tothii]|uniref:uncharacterized protein n=1 Tax=Dipodascopsis tothii TaxID=44089 RepID=UPI0034CFF710
MLLTLPASVISQIRSTQSISSIAWIIVECVQNSIDSGATRITVEISCSQRSLVIIDNGHGITSSDFAALGSRYATSKASSLASFTEIQTYGFRGEALANISAISLLTVSSKTAGGSSTYTKVINQGKFIFSGESDTDIDGHGTTIKIQNIFANIPVRKRLLLSDDFLPESTVRDIREHIVEILLTSRPVDVSVVSKSQSRLETLLHVTAERYHASSLCQFLCMLYGQPAFRPLLNLSHQYNSFHVEGVIFATTQSSRRRYIFLNNRKVQNNLLKTVVDLTKKLLALPRVSSQSTEHLGFVLNATGPLEAYDLCQDPSKVLYTFRGQCDLEKCVVQAIQIAFEENGIQNETPVEIRTGNSLRTFFKERKQKQMASPKDRPPPFSPEIPSLCSQSSLGRSHYFDQAGTYSRLLTELKFSRDDLKNCSIISQVSSRFILAKARPERVNYNNKPPEDVLFLIDQHAADERIRVEALMKEYYNAIARGDDISVAFVANKVFVLGEEDGATLNEHLSLFRTWGYELELIGVAPGHYSFELRRVPAVLSARCRQDTEYVLNGIKEHISALQSGRSCTLDTNTMSLGRVERAMPVMIRDMLNFKACRGAVMFGDKLAEEECRILVGKLQNCRLPFQCAHGRPSMIPLAGLGLLAGCFRDDIT